MRNIKLLWAFMYLLYVSHVIKCGKPSGKQQQAVWRLECELGVISDSECPVDGGWTPWSPWSHCYGSCDDVGHRRRVRQCINPPPSQDGFPCIGDDNQIESCYITNCTLEDFRRIIRGDAVRVEALHQLETVPALMESCLTKECPIEAIQVALEKDNTWQISPEALWNSLQCVKRNLGCPVVGEWGAWGTWSSCGARCGYGLKWRLRRCDSPSPSNAHLICTGTPLQADECQGDQCAINKRDSTGTWGEWGHWSTCSEKCGAGVRRRKRKCFEMTTPQLFGSWVTHCRGQHDLLEVCENNQCELDGGWSGWGPWGQCSQTCGAGRRSRARTCTRPVPAGNGTPCTGLRTEIGTCNLNPCDVKTHYVAVFNGESYLNYDFENKRSSLFHFYVRFLPLSPHGTLVRRGAIHNPIVRLSLQKWHLCLDANGLTSFCTVSRICSHSALEAAAWHSALITVTRKSVTMRIDDAPETITGSFSCDPDLPAEKINIYVGEKLHGEIQELIVNFTPLHMMLQGTSNITNLYPRLGYNVAYERAGTEEAYLNLENDQYLRLPCFEKQTEWEIQLIYKSKRDTGTVLFLYDDLAQSWLYLSLQNKRLKLKLALGEFRSESSSSTECLSDQWFDVTLSKKQETKTIEAIINRGEHLHVSFEENLSYKRNSHAYNLELKNNTPFTLCSDEFFIGGLPAEVKKRISAEGFPSFSGVIAYLNVNDIVLDLHSHPVERSKHPGNKVQVSSRTASVSGYYHETAWGPSNLWNLTCLHARDTRTPNSAHWLYLDTTVTGSLKEKLVRSIDDGRVLKLVATANNDLRGFYTCRAHSNKRTRNIVTYGVLGKIEHRLNDPDLTTALAVVTTLALVLGTLLFLLIEGVHDTRNGYGFYRDAHMTPEEEAEAVCKFIDQNIDYVGADAAKLAKAKARRIGKQLASRASFAAQEPQGMEAEHPTSNESIQSDTELCLPALPEIKSNVELSQKYTCAPSFVSSPRHGSMSPPRSRPTSSSSFDISPRVLCSRLTLSRRKHSPRDSSNKRNSFTQKARTLLTIKSSSFVNESPVQKILQKFQQLKKEDTDN